jgi:hypothetical protein
MPRGKAIVLALTLAAAIGGCGEQNLLHPGDHDETLNLLGPTAHPPADTPAASVFHEMPSPQATALSSGASPWPLRAQLVFESPSSAVSRVPLAISKREDLTNKQAPTVPSLPVVLVAPRPAAAVLENGSGVVPASTSVPASTPVVLPAPKTVVPAPQKRPEPVALSGPAMGEPRPPVRAPSKSGIPTGGDSEAMIPFPPLPPAKLATPFPEAQYLGPRPPSPKLGEPLPPEESTEWFPEPRSDSLSASAPR